MKVRASVKKISPDDIIVRRKGVLRVINKKKVKDKNVVFNHTLHCNGCRF